jgi:hypothetical protein
LTELRRAAADPLLGVFGPRSMTWQVDREAAIFLGAGRALAAISGTLPSQAGPPGSIYAGFSLPALRMPTVFLTLLRARCERPGGRCAG